MALPSHMWQDDGPRPKRRTDTTDADGTEREQREAPLSMGHGRVFNLFKKKRGRSTAVMYKYHFAALLVLLASCALHSRSFYTRGGGGIVLFWIQFDFWALRGQRAMEQPPIARDTPPLLLLAGLPARD